MRKIKEEFERKQAEMSEFYGLSKELVSKSKHVERHVERRLKSNLMQIPQKPMRKIRHKMQNHKS